MERLIGEIQKLAKGEIGETVHARVAELLENRKTPESVFSELCFCLLTANSSAEMGLKVQGALGSKGFEMLEQGELSTELLRLGYRFYNVRAKYICEARAKKEIVWMMLKESEHEREMRETLVQTINGLGYKEASHFLRNLGFMDVAILDRHILRVMDEQGMITLEGEPKALSAKKYVEYEKLLDKLCDATGLKQGELDFYLWHMKTGKVLK